ARRRRGGAARGCRGGRPDGGRGGRPDGGRGGRPDGGRGRPSLRRGRGGRGRRWTRVGRGTRAADEGVLVGVDALRTLRLCLERDRPLSRLGLLLAADGDDEVDETAAELAAEPRRWRDPELRRTDLETAERRGRLAAR